MRNNFCRLIEPELKKLDADVSLDLMGMLWSPFQMNERNGYIHVPVETFQEITNFLTDHALYLASSRKDQAVQAAPQQLLNEKDQRLDAIGEWAIGRWHAEVANRPLANVHRRSLDDTWRQIIRHLGIDDVAVCGLAHDDLLALYARGVRPDDACAHSHANKLGCPECGEEFNGDEVKP